MASEHVGGHYEEGKWMPKEPELNREFTTTNSVFEKEFESSEQTKEFIKALIANNLSYTLAPYVIVVGNTVFIPCINPAMTRICSEFARRYTLGK